MSPSTSHILDNDCAADIKPTIHASPIYHTISKNDSQRASEYHRLPRVT